LYFFESSSIWRSIKSERAFPSTSWLFEAQFPISVEDGYMRLRVRGEGVLEGDYGGREGEGEEEGRGEKEDGGIGMRGRDVGWDGIGLG
jgi:hypothetical protein